MNSAQAYFKSVPDVLAALKEQLEPLKLADDVTAAFERIEIFDEENLMEAFKRLLVGDQRTCLIIPLTARWDQNAGENPRTVRRTLPVVLLISDQVIGDRTAALFGGAANPGAYGLSAIAVPAVTGQLIANPGGVVCTPVNESVVIVREADGGDAGGRAAVALELECQGGWLRALLDVSPTL